MDDEPTDAELAATVRLYARAARMHPRDWLRMRRVNVERGVMEEPSRIESAETIDGAVARYVKDERD